MKEFRRRIESNDVIWQVNKRTLLKVEMNISRLASG